MEEKEMSVLVLESGGQAGVVHQTGNSDGSDTSRDGSDQARHPPHTHVTVTRHSPPLHPVETHVNDHRARLDDVLVQEAGHSGSRHHQV